MTISCSFFFVKTSRTTPVFCQTNLTRRSKHGCSRIFAPSRHRGQLPLSVSDEPSLEEPAFLPHSVCCFG
jgi:hypothetical protein